VDVNAEQLQLGDRVLKGAVGIRLTILQQTDGGDGARDEGTGSPLRVYTYGQRLHFIRQAANAAQLSQSRCDGYGRLSRLPRHSPDRFLPRQQRGGTAGFRGQPHRVVEEPLRVAASWPTSMQLWHGERGALMQAMLIGGRHSSGATSRRNSSALAPITS